MKSIQTRRRNRATSRGLTLTEIMISLAILAIFAGGAAAAIFPQFAKAKIKTSEQQAQAIREASMRWRASRSGGDCPTVSQLVTDKELTSTANQTNDPWGNPYKISCSGDDDITVQSNGPDGKESASDDIVVPKK